MSERKADGALRVIAGCWSLVAVLGLLASASLALVGRGFPWSQAPAPGGPDAPLLFQAAAWLMTHWSLSALVVAVGSTLVLVTSLALLRRRRLAALLLEVTNGLCLAAVVGAVALFAEAWLRSSGGVDLPSWFHAIGFVGACVAGVIMALPFAAMAYTLRSRRVRQELAA